MGFIARVLRGFGGFFAEHRGPSSRILGAQRNCHDLFKMLYEKAQPISQGTRIKSSEGSNEAVVSISWDTLANAPWALSLGLEKFRPQLGLYAVQKGNKKVVVVADIAKAVAEDMPFPDLYVIEEGKYIKVGRSGENDIVFHPVHQSISGDHLRIVFAEGSNMIYIFDVSRNGTEPNLLKKDVSYPSEYKEAIPLKIEPSMI